MIRDPFDIHRKNAFKATAFRAAQNIRDTAAQVGASALDMSFNMPKHVPNFAAPHRDLEDRAWASVSRRSGASAGGNFLSGVQDKVSGYFDEESLPMYKDKPYGYSPSMRRRPWWRRKRIISTVVLSFLTISWLTGLIGGRSRKQTATSALGWLGMSKSYEPANWDERRQSVVEAFELSWDTYERNAWGMFLSSV